VLLLRSLINIFSRVAPKFSMVFLSRSCVMGLGVSMPLILKLMAVASNMLMMMGNERVPDFSVRTMTCSSLVSSIIIFERVTSTNALTSCVN